MRSVRMSHETFSMAALTLAFLVFSPALTSGQGYPTKPITIYCGYEAGASTDLTARALASGAEKLLGVPVVVENKAGGAASVSATLLASKAPDGYTLAVFDTVLLTARPHLLAVSYNSLKDFTYILTYGLYVGGICVLAESPLNTIDDFIRYAKAHPGMSFGSAGLYSRGHLAIECFAQCKGLTFKHVPFKGGAPANTALLGKHVDFVAGVGQHIQYVKQGVFRMLEIFNTEKRDPHFPNIPIQRELGCEDVPPNWYIVAGPRGLPNPIYKKLNEVFKKVSETPDFRKVLESLTLPYEYKDGPQLEKAVAAQYEWYRTFLQKMGVKKQG